jgi:hypothetical protein
MLPDTVATVPVWYAKVATVPFALTQFHRSQLGESHQRLLLWLQLHHQRHCCRILRPSTKRDGTMLRRGWLQFVLALHAL